MARSGPFRPSTRDRLVRAAVEEFAARGFDGTTVDRIAARARVNKAMLYYHFRSKVALYRAILRGLFAEVAAAVGAVRQAGLGPEDEVRRFIAVLATEAAARPHFPAMWLREIADGGRHLDASVLAEMRRVIDTLARILADGHRAGSFRPAHPVLTQIGVVAPLLFFAASGPLRARLGSARAGPPGRLEPEAVIRHVQEATLAGLSAAAAPGRRRSRQGRPV